MATKHFQTGEVIFEEGEVSHEAFFLVSGTVEISIQSATGPHVLGRLGSGEIFGEMGMISERPRSATARALEPTVVESINEDAFEGAILNHPERLRAYLATLFDRIRNTDLLLQMELKKEHDIEALAHRRAATPASAMLEVPAAGKPLPVAAGKPRHELYLHSVPERPGRPISADVQKLPFRIGRAYGDAGVPLFVRNDLSIPDQHPYHVSRSHCEIDYTSDGYVVRDRGSKLGTIVNGNAIGMHTRSHMAVLHPGENYLVFGAEASPHRFVLTLKEV